MKVNFYIHLRVVENCHTFEPNVVAASLQDTNLTGNYG